MMNETAAVVILYHADAESVFININSYLRFVGGLIIVDNSPEMHAGLKQRIEELPAKAIYIANSVNRGIAAALNIGADRALKDGYSWLLTMDQDSSFKEQEVEKYFSLFRTTFSDTNEVAMISPIHGGREEGTSKSYHEVLSSITSGSLLKLEIWHELGGFDEKLFIDEVDHEFCYRAVAAGYKIISFNQVHLTHNLGRNVTGGYFGQLYRKTRMVHNPLRVYYMVRNYLYVRKQYYKKFPGEFAKRDKQMRVILKNNLFFSGNFLQNVKSIIKGYMDYKRNNFNAEI